MYKGTPNKKVIVTVFGFLFLTASLGLGVYLSQLVQKTGINAAGVNLVLSSNNTAPQVGGTFVAAVTMNTQGLLVTGSEIKIKYDPTRLTATSVVPGPFLPYIFIPGNIDIVNGIADIVVGPPIDSTGAHPVSGTGLVVSVNFTAKALGTTAITFDPGTKVSVSGQTTNQVGVTTPVTITVANPTPTPSPTPTKSPSPSPTLVPTPTRSPSPTPTPTPVPTRSPSPTPTKSPSPSPTLVPTPTRSPSPTPTFVPTPTPTKTPTPVPTNTPSPVPTPVACSVTTSPTSQTLTVGTNGVVNAVVDSGLGTSTITAMHFGSYNTAVVVTNSSTDTSSPYSTTVTALSQGSAAVWATAYLADGRVCQSTATTDSDINVVAKTPSPSPSPSPSPTPSPLPTASPSPSPTPFKTGDVNHDGVVNIVDIGLIIDNYSLSPLPDSRCDLNGDGVANIIDIGIVVDFYEF